MTHTPDANNQRAAAEQKARRHAHRAGLTLNKSKERLPGGTTGLWTVKHGDLVLAENVALDVVTDIIAARLRPAAPVVHAWAGANPAAVEAMFGPDQDYPRLNQETKP